MLHRLDAMSDEIHTITYIAKILAVLLTLDLFINIVILVLRLPGIFR